MDLERGRSLVRRGQLGSPFLRAVSATGRILRNASTSPAAALTAAAVARRFVTPPTPGMSRSRSRGRKRLRFSRSRSRSRSVAPSITTEQRDSSVRYVRRRSGGVGRRRARRFANRVRNVMLRMGPTQTFSRRFGAAKTVPVNQQIWDGHVLGGTQMPNNDEIFAAFRQAYGTGITGTNIDSYRLFIKSMVLDVQITNTSDKNLIFDMYTLVNRKRYNVAERLDTQMTTFIGEIDAPTGFSFTATDPGYTLFQVPQFCQYWSVEKKQQIVLSANETTTLQMRMPFNKMFNGKLIETDVQCMRGARAFMWSTKGSPESDGAGGVQYADGSFVWTSQITVNYQIPPSTTIQRSATTT